MGIREEKRKKLSDKLGSTENKKRIPKAVEAEYLKRLNKTYNILGTTYNFYNQFNNGEGKELEGKFWSPSSSSRYAFEMYSWLANEDICKHIEFEKLLPQIHDAKGKHINIKSPDMDVFYALNNDIFFIESKFLESCSLSQKPSISYYENNKGPKSLLNRYHKSEMLEKLIPLFIKKVYEYVDKNGLVGCKDWFYPKQEITHVVGISLYLFDNPSFLEELKSGNKKLHFYNVVYKTSECTCQTIKKFRKWFALNVNKLFEKMFDIEIDYQFKYSQDYIVELLNISKNKDLTKGYASDKTVLELLLQFEAK